MSQRLNGRPLVLSRLDNTLLNEVVKVTLLRVVVGVLVLGPVVDAVDFRRSSAFKYIKKKGNILFLQENNAQKIRGGAT